MKIHGTAKGGALSTKDFGVAFGGNGAIAPTFNEDYESTDDWTFNPTSGNTFTINDGGNGLLLSTNTEDDVLNQCYRTMNTLPTEWTLKIEYKPTSTANNIFPCSITENSSEINSQAKGIGIKANGGTQLTVYSVLSGSVTNPGGYNTSLVLNTQYYIKIVNDDTNIIMSIFENSDYESDQVGSDISITDPNFTTLDTLQHCGRSDGGGGDSIDFAINNFSMFDDT